MNETGTGCPHCDAGSTPLNICSPVVGIYHRVEIGFSPCTALASLQEPLSHTGRDGVLEDAAKVAFDALEDQQRPEWMRAANGVAAAIRALKSAPLSAPADGVTDEIVDVAFKAWESRDVWLREKAHDGNREWYRENIRAALQAALTAKVRP